MEAALTHNLVPVAELDGQTGGNGGGNGVAVISEAIASEPPALPNEVGDDRDNIRPGDDVLLIVENDLAFAQFLLDAAREKGFKGLVTSLGAAALAMTRDHMPSAITLDIFLPDIEGWRVLDRLKNDLTTRHIPVCVISTEEARERALGTGAMAFVTKPIKTRAAMDNVLECLKAYAARKHKSLLVVEPEPDRRRMILECVDVPGVDVTVALSEAAALDALRGGHVDCVVLSSQVGEADAEAIARIVETELAARAVPMLVFGEDAPRRYDRAVKRLAQAGPVRLVQSSERLLDQVAFFLHSEIARLPAPRREALEGLHRSDHVLPGKKVLIVDDDMRNIFALSTVLEERDMVVISADNGRDAIKILQTQPDVDVVLMDIMMPEMDGIDTMREIRKLAHLKALPIIAVTAKAMMGDREKCIEAGAWDYLSKPVDTEQMLAVLRGWLHR
jgi:CheY-like chemotaxis protein